MSRRLVLALLCWLLIGLPGLHSVVAQGSASSSLIAFVSERDGNEEIYVMASDGANQTNLTNNPARDWHPVWSPDGARVAFTSDRDGNEEIYVMNADGSGQTNLTNFAGPDNSPTFSPDGTRLAWASERDGWDIWAMNLDGSGLTRITDDGVIKTDPAWSPDGQLIAYWQLVNGQTDIFVVDVISGVTARLTDTPADDGWPRWSSDGLIMFDTRRDGNWEIYVMNVDGTNPINLTRNRATDGRPSWSDWHWRIAFGSERDGNLEIYTMIVDGTSLRRLTVNDAPDHSPVWQPNPNFTGAVLGMTEFVQLSYTPDRLLIHNPTPDQWMFLSDVAVVDALGNRLPLDQPSALGGTGAIERLGPGECLFVRMDTAARTAPPESCQVVQQIVMPDGQNFWLGGFQVDSVTSDALYNCTAAVDQKLTVCLMPR